MKKHILLLYLLLVVSISSIFGQQPAIKAKTPCLLAKSNLSSISDISLGADYSALKKVYAEMIPATSSPFANTTAYYIQNPLSNVSLIAVMFSTNNKLVAYSVYYQPQQWNSIEEPTEKLIDSLKLAIPKTMWDFWKENGKESITVECKDFGLYTSLKQEKDKEKKVFLFTVIDKAFARKATTEPKLISPKKLSIPAITSSNNSSYLFPQKSSEYTVEFPEKPTFKTLYTEAGTAEQATVITNDSVLRVEYGTLTAQQINGVVNSSEDQFNQVGLSIGKMVGYTGTSVSSGKTALGRYLKIRGYKITEGSSTLVEHLIYYGKNSVITLVTASKAENYPTKTITTFIETLKLNTQ